MSISKFYFTAQYVNFRNNAYIVLSFYIFQMFFQTSYRFTSKHLHIVSLKYGVITIGNGGTHIVVRFLHTNESRFVTCFSTHNLTGESTTSIQGHSSSYAIRITIVNSCLISCINFLVDIPRLIHTTTASACISFNSNTAASASSI